MPILHNFPMKDNRPGYTKSGHFVGVGEAGELMHRLGVALELVVRRRPLPRLGATDRSAAFPF